ncbi:MAG: hypothetical protein JNK43_09530 [Ignavibacteria bacterium]|nr:hypothetical protein [Ignavibacteria bacterium]
MRLKKDKKISKGYRLRPETHKMITKVQKILKTDYDDTLWFLCNEYIIKLNNIIKENTK